MAVAGHLTCVGATQQQVGKVIDDYIAAGVRHIVALRGGAPDGSTGGSSSLRSGWNGMGMGQDGVMWCGVKWGGVEMGIGWGWGEMEWGGE